MSASVPWSIGARFAKRGPLHGLERAVVGRLGPIILGAAPLAAGWQRHLHNAFAAFEKTANLQRVAEDALIP